jgi:hypothetical protein
MVGFLMQAPFLLLGLAAGDYVVPWEYLGHGERHQATNGDYTHPGLLSS